MHEPGRENDAGRKGFGRDKEAAVGPEKPAVFSYEGNGDPDDSGDENRSDGD